MAEVTKDLRGFLIPTKLLKEGNLATWTGLISSFFVRHGPVAQPLGHNPEGPGPIRNLTGTTYPLKEGEGSIISVSGPFSEFSAPRVKGHGLGGMIGLPTINGYDYQTGVSLTCVRGGDGGPGSEPGFSIRLSGVDRPDAGGAATNSIDYGWWQQGGIREISKIPVSASSNSVSVGACSISESRFALSYRRASDGELLVEIFETTKHNGITLAETLVPGFVCASADVHTLCMGRDGKIYGCVVDFDEATEVATYVIDSPNDNTLISSRIIDEKILIGDFSTATAYLAAVLYHHRDLTFSLFLRVDDGTGSTGVSKLYRSKDYLSSLEDSGVSFGALGLTAIPRRDTLVILEEKAGDDLIWEFTSGWDAGTTAFSSTIDVSSTHDLGWEDHTGRVYVVNRAYQQSYFHDIGDVTTTGWVTTTPATNNYFPALSAFMPTIFCGGGAMTIVPLNTDVGAIRWGGWDPCESQPYNPWGGTTENQYGLCYLGWERPDAADWTVTETLTTGSWTSRGGRLYVTLGAGEYATWSAEQSVANDPEHLWIRFQGHIEDDPDTEVRIRWSSSGAFLDSSFAITITRPSTTTIGWEIDGDTVESGTFDYVGEGDFTLDFQFKNLNSLDEYVVACTRQTTSGRTELDVDTGTILTGATLGGTSFCDIRAYSTSSALPVVTVGLVGFCFTSTATTWPLFRYGEKKRGAPLVADYPIALPLIGQDVLTDAGEVIRTGQPGAVLVRGPYSPGTRWEAYATSDTDPRQLLPDVYPGPSRGFRGTQDSETVSFAAIPRTDDVYGAPEATLGPVWGVYVDGVNRETVTVETTTISATTLLTIDMTDPSGIGTFEVTLQERIATFQPARYLFRNELVGSHIRVEDAGDYRHYRIAANTEGGPAGKPCRLTLEADEQARLSTGTYDAIIIFKHAYVIMGGSTDIEWDIGLSITADAGTHTYPRPGATCSVFALGEVVLFSPEWDARWQMEHLPDRTEEGREGYTSRTKQGPTIRRLTLGWTDAGTDLTRLRSGAFDWVEDSSNNPVSNIGDAGYNLSGILEDLDGGTRPMLVVRKAVEFGTPCYDPTCFLWGHLDSSVALENDLGDEGDNEQIRVQTLTFTEAK